jgi:hypothetical protein
LTIRPVAGSTVRPTRSAFALGSAAGEGAVGFGAALPIAADPGSLSSFGDISASTIERLYPSGFYSFGGRRARFPTPDFGAREPLGAGARAK